MFDTQSLCVGRNLYLATPIVTWGPLFFRYHGLVDLIAFYTYPMGMWRTYCNLNTYRSPFSRLLRLAWGCCEAILTRILTCPYSVASQTTHREMLRTYSYLDPHGSLYFLNDANLFSNRKQCVTKQSPL